MEKFLKNSDDRARIINHQGDQRCVQFWLVVKPKFVVFGVDGTVTSTNSNISFFGCCEDQVTMCQLTKHWTPLNIRLATSKEG